MCSEDPPPKALAKVIDSIGRVSDYLKEATK